ncbi:MAG TPA: hypothetical protein VFZ91_12145 [Allosphingosinicella sp.]
MADGQHKLSRRALLGAALAPALVRHSGLDPESTCLTITGQKRWIPDQVRDDESSAVPIWDRALTRFRQAQAALEAAVHEPDQDAYDTLLDAATAALCALLHLPAPGLPAFAAKLELIVAHQAWELGDGEVILEALQQDARRLAAAAV